MNAERSSPGSRSGWRQFAAVLLLIALGGLPLALPLIFHLG
ncbi:MAG TPA: hypothetical protein VEF92_03085 [Burkholderiales bacterium]|nr:hypothetical protein [Burkholderiales bacterium]